MFRNKSESYMGIDKHKSYISNNRLQIFSLQHLKIEVDVKLLGWGEKRKLERVEKQKKSLFSKETFFRKGI